MSPSLQDRFVAALLGHALGDAIGAPFEGLSAEAIARDLGGARNRISLPPRETLCYTDDTQMLIGVAECLVVCGRVDAQVLLQRFVANFEVARGYGQGVRQLIEAAAAGADAEGLATLVFPGGSYGNGAAMRATPVGLLFHKDVDKVVREARRSALPTHGHPLGVEGAVLFAAAVAICLRDVPFERNAFFSELGSLAVEEEYQWQLRTAARLSPSDRIPFGSSLPAHRSVVSALCCFANHPDSFLDAVITAVSLGDDTDTLAGMAGALVGARHGTSALPTAHLAQLENKGKGVDYLRGLAINLHARL